ncbi:uncharacterized protein BDW43DRAFT_260543 [Aspergillus alliaceus]|uniref:uncharacterized protein n=1 Tax=Petromyces alliaceus TaxID=209559 RepID=UPI0012A4B02A|nr:uncharacterized protein BDW43DRAFT_260543 [Aspergillus alliaceus]KAB8239089.1 hypothetical protein BDW43DRAFT_260543 [Aspergillus alliaceus]
MIPARFRKVPLLVSPLLALLLFYYLFSPNINVHLPGKGQVHTHSRTTIISGSNNTNPPECPELPGINDVLVVLKTGATEALQKVPVHFNTTLKCIPHFVLFSDFEEEIAGVQAHDVLRSVDESIKDTSLEFDLYNRLRKFGRAGLTSDDIGDDPSTPSGKPENRGWKLDKWKFLPMINETLRVRADAKWYVFMEADTYVVWPNLLKWLEKFDPSKPYYMGSQVNIGDLTFAHGGSGYVISQAAMHMVSDHRASRVEEYDRYTAESWAGDCVLGKALHDVGVSLFFSVPLLQGDTPWTFRYYGPKEDHHWCSPAVTYHHMVPDDIREMWRFESSWWAYVSTHPGPDICGDMRFDRIYQTEKEVLLHADVFEELAHPAFGELKDNWDNASTDENNDGVDNLEDCKARCRKDGKCHQYSYEPGKCFTSKVARRGTGKPGTGITSGWMPERINKKVRKLGTCKKPRWITP